MFRPPLLTDFVLDAPEQAIYDRRGQDAGTLVHRSARGAQYLSMRYTHRLADAAIAPSVGSRGDSYDNALAESVIGSSKRRSLDAREPWRTIEAVTLPRLGGLVQASAVTRAHWLIPPAEYEAEYHAQAAVA